ncbi:hypothetical protein SAMN05444274_10537 [Mariniphaga anaerophila]|uniref:Rieske domain-containing protein n=1 Tax=Mariniphaga anaerophila TaxID=1484053 RepID=A0A1M5B8W9_9BACT|nr:hypothetical protein [Mariniphaga anaerophila]SHF39001.1 hypothetical protein SAMN05444274_10537 [Mariniphaga anaerophila]
MQQVVLKCLKYFLFFLFLALFSPSCDKINDSPIPDVYVSFTVNLNIVNELNVSGNSVYFPNVGYGGVIVYCEMPGSWYAFDATCTYEAGRSCIVKNDGVLATCPCCESEFVLISGAYPTKSPATLPLKQYHVSIMNSFTLRVYN